MESGAGLAARVSRGLSSATSAAAAARSGTRRPGAKGLSLRRSFSRREASGGGGGKVRASRRTGTMPCSWKPRRRAAAQKVDDAIAVEEAPVVDRTTGDAPVSSRVANVGRKERRLVHAAVQCEHVIGLAAGGGAAMELDHTRGNAPLFDCSAEGSAPGTPTPNAIRR